MRTHAILLSVLIALAAPIAIAQAPEKPVPSDAHKKLAFFVGNWKGDGEMKANPMTPAGKYESNDSCSWFEGGFAVVCNSSGKGPMGTMKGIGIISYSADEGKYTYYGADSSGMTMTTVSMGTLKDGTWVFTDEAKMGGQLVKSRYTMRELSETAYSFTWEMMGEDGKYAVVMEGKQTKTK